MVARVSARVRRSYGMGELKAKFRSLETPEGPYELSDGAGGAANLNREMIRLLDFVEQLGKPASRFSVCGAGEKCA